MNGLEKSTIDFVIVSSELVDHIESIVIDEDKVNCLSSNVRTKKGVKVTKSDHNSIITNFKVMWEKGLKKHKKELFNLKDSEGQQKFKHLTSKEGMFTNIFNDKTKDIEGISKKFLKILEGSLHQCFSKIRVKEKGNKELDSLFNKRRLLRTKSDNNSKK